MITIPPTSSKEHFARQTILLAAVLLILFASRMPHVLSFPMDADEVWTAWQGIGSLDKVLAWVPYDWPPLHYVLVWVWQSLVSPHPLFLRLLSTFSLLLGAASMYRVTLRLTSGRGAALLGMLTYASFGYIVYLSVLVRGYALLYALVPPLLLLSLRYFDKSTWRRAIPAAICMAATFYTHLSVVALFPFIGLLILALHPRKIWRWWLPAVIALILVIPVIAQQLPLVISRAPIVQSVTPPPFFESLAAWYTDFTGNAAIIWLIALILAAILTLVRYPRLGIVLVLWSLAPMLMLLFNSRLGFFSLRHLAWVGVGLALLLALAAQQLSRRLVAASVTIAVLMAWLPFPPDRYILPDTKPNIMIFSWLRDEWRAGDVVFVDPTTNPVPPETWDYFAEVYFPDGLPIVASPIGYRRVWYATVDGWDRPEDKALVENGRIASEFIGPWNFLLRLYEGPPDAEGTLFENGLRFHGMEAIGTRTPGYLITHEDDQLRLRLWWAVDQGLSADYSIAVQLLDQNGALIAQTPDRSGSAEVPKETSRWQVGQLYVEEMVLPIPPKSWQGNPATVEYQVVLAVYQWWDGVRLSAPGVNADKLLLLAPLRMTAW